MLHDALHTDKTLALGRFEKVRPSILKARATVTESETGRLLGLLCVIEVDASRNGTNIFRFGYISTDDTLPKNSRRCYMLEVYPSFIRSHIGDTGNIYGSHEHFLTTPATVTAIDSPLLSCNNFDMCWRWFCSRTRTRHQRITNPLEYEL